MKLKLDKKTHTYTDGSIKYKSVTTLISEYFPKFDEKEVAKKLSKMPKFKAEKKGVRYWLKEWKKNREYGTEVHNEIDKSFKDKKFIPTLPESIMAYHDYKEYKIMTEVQVYNNYYGLAGTIDGIIINEDTSISLIDWKVTKEISKENKYDKSINNLGLKNANFWKYSLQLNMYAYLLKLQGYNVKDMTIVHLKKDEIIQYSVPVMFDIIGTILEEVKK